MSVSRINQSKYSTCRLDHGPSIDSLRVDFDQLRKAHWDDDCYFDFDFIEIDQSDDSNDMTSQAARDFLKAVVDIRVNDSPSKDFWFSPSNNSNRLVRKNGKSFFQYLARINDIV